MRLTENREKQKRSQLAKTLERHPIYRNNPLPDVGILPLSYRQYCKKVFNTFMIASSSLLAHFSKFAPH